MEKTQNVLIVGAGASAHALAWKLGQSKNVDIVYIVPGNAGTMQLKKCTNLDVDPMNNDILRGVVIEKDINLLVVASGEVSVDIVDYFKEDSELHQMPIFGPTKESRFLKDKLWAENFMNDYEIPNKSFDKEQSQDALEFNEGVDVSVSIITDGENYVILPVSKSYKRIGEIDSGLNTEGMGAVSPLPFTNTKFMQKVEDRIIRRTLLGLEDVNLDCWGVINFDLMNVDGDPYLVEYGIGFGDAEMQTILPLIKTDLLPIFEAAFTGDVCNYKIEIEDAVCVTVVAASGGYPENYEKGYPITGLNQEFEDATQEIKIFHAGTFATDDSIVTNGGRVLSVVAIADTIAQAAEIANKRMEGIDFKGITYRKDIGHEFIK